MRELSEKNKNAKQLHERKHLIHEIKYAAKFGDKFTHLYIYYDENIDYLKELGYKVDSTTNGNDRTFKIDWE